MPKLSFTVDDDGRFSYEIDGQAQSDVDQTFRFARGDTIEFESKAGRFTVEFKFIPPRDGDRSARPWMGAEDGEDSLQSEKDTFGVFRVVRQIPVDVSGPPSGPIARYRYLIEVEQDGKKIRNTRDPIHGDFVC